MDAADLRATPHGTVVDPSRARTAAWAAAAAAVIGFGIAIRIVQIAHERSLWLDEAMLALNLIDRSYPELFGELQFMQAGPPGFLVAAKLSGDVLGYEEHALRLVPLVAGLAALLVFARLSGEFVSGLGRVVALLIVALSPPLVYYSSEVKQYSTDVLVTVVVLLLAVFFRKRPLDARHIALMSVAGGAAVVFSYASVFALAGALVALAVDAVERSEWRRLGLLAVPTSLCAAGLGACYALTRPNIEPIRASLSGTSAYADGIAWYPTQTAYLGFSLFGNPGTWGKVLVVVAGLLAAVGTVSLARQDRFKPVLLLTPLVAAMVAATLGLYPFGGRFVLFGIPVLALLIGCGVAAVGSSARSSLHRFVVPVVAASAVGGLLVVQAGPDLVSPRERQELRPVLEYVRAHWRPGDVLYLHAASQHAARYYAEVHQVNVQNDTVLWQATRAPGGARTYSPSLFTSLPELVVGRSAEDGRVGFEADLRMLAGRPRVWFVFSHVVRWDGGGFVDDMPGHIAILDRAGERVDEFHRTGAAAYLVDVREEPHSVRG